MYDASAIAVIDLLRAFGHFLCHMMGIFMSRVCGERIVFQTKVLDGVFEGTMYTSSCSVIFSSMVMLCLFSY